MTYDRFGIGDTYHIPPVPHILPKRLTLAPLGPFSLHLTILTIRTVLCHTQQIQHDTQYLAAHALAVTREVFDRDVGQGGVCLSSERFAFGTSVCVCIKVDSEVELQ